MSKSRAFGFAENMMSIAFEPISFARRARRAWYSLAGMAAPSAEWAAKKRSAMIRIMARILAAGH